jgi:hypothetical protein
MTTDSCKNSIIFFINLDLSHSIAGLEFKAIMLFCACLM